MKAERVKEPAFPGQWTSDECEACVQFQIRPMDVEPCDKHCSDCREDWGKNYQCGCEGCEEFACEARNYRTTLPANELQP